MTARPRMELNNLSMYAQGLAKAQAVATDIKFNAVVCVVFVGHNILVY